MRLLKRIVIVFLLLAAALLAAIYFAPEPKPGEVSSDNVMSEIKGLMGHTQELSDTELGERIRSIAESHGLPLVDSQVDQLVGLCRGAESLSGEELAEKADELKGTIDALVNTGRQISKIARYLNQAREFTDSVIGKAREIFGQ